MSLDTHRNQIQFVHKCLNKCFYFRRKLTVVLNIYFCGFSVYVFKTTGIWNPFVNLLDLDVDSSRIWIEGDISQQRESFMYESLNPVSTPIHYLLNVVVVFLSNTPIVSCYLPWCVHSVQSCSGSVWSQSPRQLPALMTADVASSGGDMLKRSAVSVRYRRAAPLVCVQQCSDCLSCLAGAEWTGLWNHCSIFYRRCVCGFGFGPWTAQLCSIFSWFGSETTGGKNMWQQSSPAGDKLFYLFTD